MNLPQIQNFYGNTDFNNWIANCKLFQPKLNVNHIVDFIPIELSESLKQHIEMQQQAWNDLFNHKWI